jgi:uncharacterized protein YbaR (Trm112 family)
MVQAQFSCSQRQPLELDLCFSCHGIWFDRHESTRLAPASVIDLFRQIHAHRDTAHTPLTGTLHCPRCNRGLQHQHDLGKSGRFNYYRCVGEHGRFTPFSQFMTEKGFVRQMTAVEISALAARIGSIHCHACGAPFDIRHDPACPFCRAPITILDEKAVEQALARYHRADIQQHHRDPAELADALLNVERQRIQFQRSQARGAQSLRATDTIEVVESTTLVADLIVGGVELIGGLFD